MGTQKPPPVSLRRAIHLSLLALFYPAEFTRLEDAEKRSLEQQAGSASSPPERGAFKLRRATLVALLLVVAAGAFGFVVAKILEAVYGPASPQTILRLQVGGALVLLWGTLAVRGWDIQTIGGITLSERVNQWIYRFLYCTGTAILVCSVVWTSKAGG